MDHHHQWRQPPPPPNTTTICLVCSTPHFPFCIPPPPYIQNPTFHYPQQPPLNYNYNYNYNDTRPPQPAYYSSNNRDGGYSYNDGFDNSGSKRMKVDANLGPFTPPDISRFTPLANDRVLKMIHDHGTSQNANTMPRIGEPMFMATNSEIRDEMGLKRRRETSEFLNPSFDRNHESNMYNNNNVHYDLRESLDYSNKEEVGLSKMAPSRNHMPYEPRHSFDT
nr:hypothetical protein [Tanacetum cinerariifolium]